MEWLIHSGSSKVKRFPILRSDVFIDNVGTDEQRNNLLQQALYNKMQYPCLDNTNEGCYRSEFPYKDMDWLKIKIDEMLTTAINFYLEEDSAYKSRFNPNNFHIEYWTNINEPGSNNRLHSHQRFDYVGLYFIQGTDTGELTFHNPANLLTDCSLNSPGVSRMSYVPQDGDLLLWPAWMPHEVETNQSTKQRINIAFNIKL